MYLAGATVPGGYYLDRDGLDLVALSGRAATLPGPDGRRYVRIPFLAVVTLAPVLGAIFVVLMPLLRLFLVTRKLARPSFASAKAGVAQLLSAFSWVRRRARPVRKAKSSTDAPADE